MKILVFSDIHGDIQALKSLMKIEADYYFAAGDMVSWSRGLEQVGEVLGRRGEKVYVLPGNHETEEAAHGMCQRFGLKMFHGKQFDAGGYYFAGLGYSTPTPFNTPGEYSEEEMAERLGAFRQPQAAGLNMPLPAQGNHPGPDPPGIAFRQPGSAVFHRTTPAAFLFLRAYSRGLKGKAS